MTFDPTSVEVTCATLPKDHYVQLPWKYIKVCGYSESVTIFKKNFKGQWPLDDLWPTSVEVTCVTHPSIIVSKSHENTSKYVDTVTIFEKKKTFNKKVNDPK